MSTKLLDESRTVRDRALQVFQYIKDTPLGNPIRIRKDVTETEVVKLLRRGRQQVRVEREDGSAMLVHLSDVLVI